jgi:oligopeptidase B
MKFSAAGANLATTQNDPQQQLSNIRIPRHLLRNPGKTYLLYQVSLTLLFLFNNRHFVPPRLLLPRVVALADSFAFVRGSSSITSRVAKRGTTTSTTFTHTKPISFLSSVVLRGGGLRSSSNSMAEESSSSNSNTVTNNGTIASPPTIWRDEERFVLVGNVTESSSSTTSMRQSEESKNPLVDPPVAVPDPYGWMRDDDRTSERVLNHLRAENAYTEQVVASCQELKDTIYQDFLRYIQETDYTTPAIKNNYIYYERTFEGKSYSVHCRAPLLSKTNNDFYTIAQGWDKSANTTILPGEQVLLDENQLAEGKSHCHVGSVQVSPSGALLAYTLDETGGEKYKLIVQNIETKEDRILAVPLEDIDSTILWGPDDTSLYYLRFDDTHRPFQVYKHILSPSPSSTENLQQDQLLFQEDDELFWVSIDKSQDEKFLFIDSSSKETSEVHFIDLFNNRTTTTNLDVVSCVSKRRTKVLYSVEHYKGSFLIATNVGGTTNMRFMVAPTLEFSEDSWVDVTRTNSSSDSDLLFTGGTEKCLEAIHVFESHVVLSGREDGMPSLWVAQFEDDHNSSSSSSSKVHSFWKLEFDEDVHDVCLGSNYEYLTDSIVINYESLITPTQSILTQLKDPNNERRIVKEKNIPGFDKSLYSCERFTVPSRDGTPIPVSMVYRKGTIPNNGINWREQSIGETVNVHLYGYGSYGMV